MARRERVKVGEAGSISGDVSEQSIGQFLLKWEAAAGFLTSYQSQKIGKSRKYRVDSLGVPQWRLEGLTNRYLVEVSGLAI